MRLNRVELPLADSRSATQAWAVIDLDMSDRPACDGHA